MLTASAALAHPPKDVVLSWDPSGSLTVTVGHSVDNPEKHYINKIVIYADNKIVATRDYSSQPNAGGLTDTFAIGEQRSGVTLKAEAFCVIMGSVSGSIVVP
jgi:desulfoferrodoxin (superoxide reductase-like protein)